MLNLMKLEIKRNRITAYLLASVAIGISMLFLLYFFAYLPHLDDDPDLLMFGSYQNIATLTAIVSMAGFTILSAVMHAKFTIEDFTGKRKILLFSYPDQKSKIFTAKSVLVFGLTVLLTFSASAVAYGIFFATESIYPISYDVITTSVFVRVLKLTAIYALTAGALGFISMRIGFIKKSVPATIVSAVVLSCLLTNYNGYDVLHSDTLAVAVMAISLAVSFALFLMLRSGINRMEAD